MLIDAIRGHIKRAGLTAIASVVCSASAEAQTRGTLGSANVATCGTIQTQPTLQSCFSCFVDMLAECRDLPTPGEREACNFGALFVFIDCYLRIAPNPTQPGAPGFEVIPEGTTVDVRSRFEFVVSDADFGNPSQLNITLVHGVGDGFSVEDITDRAIITDYAGIDTRFEIDAGTLPIRDDESVWIVVGTGEQTPQTLPAVDLFRLSVTDSFDINADGVFDAADRIAAIAAYNRGELDLDTTARILRTPH